MNTKSSVIFYVLYLIAVIGMAIPMILSALPHDTGKLNRLGYESKCSFVPWSTLSLVGILLVQIGIIYIIQVFTGHIPVK